MAHRNFFFPSNTAEMDHDQVRNSFNSDARLPLGNPLFLSLSSAWQMQSHTASSIPHPVIILFSCFRKWFFCLSSG